MTEIKIINVKSYDKKANLLANKVIRAAEARDRAKHWKAVYDLLMYQNEKVRKEAEQTAKEAKEVREAGVVSKQKSKKMGLRWGVAMPPTVWNALVEADYIAYGQSDLRDYEKETDLAGIKGSNQIVKDLEKAFPQFKVS